jgi:CRP/FNR family transcriptional regulator
MIKGTESIQDLVRRYFPQIAEVKLQEEIAEHGQIMQFSAGEVIMDYGSYVRIVPLLLEGTIKVMREDEEGNELFLYYIRTGETCSVSFTCCMMHKKSFIKTIAEDDVALIGIPIKYIDEWMGKYQSWKNFVMLSYDTRMLDMVKTIDSIAFKKMDERLLHYLKEKAKANFSKVINVTHQEIAYDLNASREAISRLLKQLEKQGVVELGRNKIILV